MKNVIQQASTPTKILLGTSVLFITYSYLCRVVGLYFFWESDAVGWPLLWVGIISLLWGRLTRKVPKREEVTLERIGIGVAGFVLVIQVVLDVLLWRSGAYAAARAGVVADKQLAAEIGRVQSISLSAKGSIQTTTDSAGEQGHAVLQVVAKGTRKFKEVTVQVVQQNEQAGWQVEKIE